MKTYLYGRNKTFEIMLLNVFELNHILYILEPKRASIFSCITTIKKTLVVIMTSQGHFLFNELLLRFNLNYVK